MRKPASGKILAVDILARSKCAVQVGCAIVDSRGILAWGWNSEGPTGMGLHAEAHAISRANKRRLAGATLFVASHRLRNGKMVRSRPCEDCQRLIDKWDLHVLWRDCDGEWK